MITRRDWVAGALAAGAAHAAARPAGTLIESHVHLFSDEPARFPLANPAARQRPYPVDEFVRFAQEARIEHAVIVHPEPYQDDHRYLEYCFEHEPVKGFFKGTCLLDPIDPATPRRLRELVARHPGRIAALRIHEMYESGAEPATGGPIRNRDLRDPRMTEVWRLVEELKLAIQMHFIPRHAPQIGELAAKFRNTPVILDHLGRAGQGTSAEFDQLLKLAEFPHVYMKFSGTGAATLAKQPFPYADAKPAVKRIYEAFGADRMLWGELGTSIAGFERAVELFDHLFDFAPELLDRAKLRGLTAKKLFAFA